MLTEFGRQLCVTACACAVATAPAAFLLRLFQQFIFQTHVLSLEFFPPLHNLLELGFGLAPLAFKLLLVRVGLRQLDHFLLQQRFQFIDCRRTTGHHRRRGATRLLGHTVEVHILGCEQLLFVNVAVVVHIDPVDQVVDLSLGEGHA